MALPERRARQLGPLLTASLALHLSVLILLLVTIQRRPRMAEQIPPADFAMVFEGHSPELNSATNPALPKAPQPGSPAPGTTAAAIPPAPAAPPSVAVLPPPPPPPPAQPPEQAHPAPAPPVSAETNPPLPIPAPVPTPAPPPAPAPLAMVIPRPPPIPAAPSPSLPSPPSPSATPHKTPQAAPSKTPARPERQPERAPAFPTPMAYSLGLPNGKAPDSTTQRATPLRAKTRIARPGEPGTIDLSFGPIEGGSLSPSASVQMEGVAVSADWLSEVSAWWERHGYYPPQAGINGEDGDVTLHMRVDHDGRVEALELISKSGSQWLDLAALSVFRDATLPPLPPDMPDKQIPFHVTVHYVLIRGPSGRHG